MVSNLLGKTVKWTENRTDVSGEVVAVYNDGPSLYICISTPKGILLSNSIYCTVVEKKSSAKKQVNRSE